MDSIITLLAILAALSPIALIVFVISIVAGNTFKYFKRKLEDMPI